MIRKGEPTVVWTSHIGEAFLLAHSIVGDARWADVVVGIGAFVLRDLPRHRDEFGVCIGLHTDRGNACPQLQPARRSRSSARLVVRR